MTIIPDMGGKRGPYRVAAMAAVGALVTTLAACGARPSGPVGGRVQVVAAENVWGSIAGQLGGEHVSVTSIVTNPGTDPHSYEPTPSDGRSVARAQFVIVNGAGYDPWAQKLVDAGAGGDRRVLTVAEVAGRHDGDNPHMWYSPAIVGQVATSITDSYKRLDPGNSSYFDRQAAAFSGAALARYNDVRAGIRARYGGQPVGSTESIFIDLAHDLGLRLITPPAYMKAVSEGMDPTTEAKSAMDAQIASRQIRVIAFNRQNSTPDVQAAVEHARAAGVPVVALTETLDPATTTFQDWQAAQLDELQKALAKATGR